MKFCLGITNDNELVFVTTSLNAMNEIHYWSMNTESYRNIFREEDLEDKAREYLDDTELWKQWVAADKTTSSLEDWIENVISSDCPESILDTTEYGDYHMEWSTIGDIEKYTQFDNYKTLFVKNKNDLALMLSLIHDDINVDTEEEVAMKKLFDKYNDQNDNAIAKLYYKIKSHED